jgi:hypothetical protein
LTGVSARRLSPIGAEGEDGLLLFGRKRAPEVGAEFLQQQPECHRGDWRGWPSGKFDFDFGVGARFEEGYGAPPRRWNGASDQKEACGSSLSMVTVILARSASMRGSFGCSTS